ncbi:MAG: response regulator transcription factor [Deltaproteobacteria bacterium]|nr:response regulator transcription factor [Deltaproteobacteria bacterium]
MLQQIKHILVVDEEAELRCSIIRHLRRNGFVMDSAFGDEDARRKITTSRKIGLPYDLVIRIFLGHHPSGIDFIGWVHRYHPEISIVIISGLGNTDWIASILNPKTDAYAQNPLTPEELMAAINCLEDRLLKSQGTEASDKLNLEINEKSHNPPLGEKREAIPERTPRIRRVESDITTSSHG